MVTNGYQKGVYEWVTNGTQVYNSGRSNRRDFTVACPEGRLGFWVPANSGGNPQSSPAPKDVPRDLHSSFS
jgi:hypothetical protein